jgi:hypothetical protein
MTGNLTGNETLEVVGVDSYGRPSGTALQTTTGAIAALAHAGSSLTVTDGVTAVDDVNEILLFGGTTGGTPSVQQFSAGLAGVAVAPVYIGANNFATPWQPDTLPPPNFSVIIGPNALVNAIDTNQDSHVAIGFEALQNLETGTFNTVVGDAAAQSATSLSFATIIGAYAGSGTPGAGVVIIGEGAGNSAGANSVIIGRLAGNSAGENSVAIGEGASATGSGSIAIGATANDGGAANSISLGGNALAANTMQIGGALADINAVGWATVTVAELPDAATVGPNYRAMVSDSTVAASGHFGSAVTGSGANTVPVWTDGTGWFIG